MVKKKEKQNKEFNDTLNYLDQSDDFKLEESFRLPGQATVTITGDESFIEKILKKI